MKKQIKKQWFTLGLLGLALAGSIFSAGNAAAASTSADMAILGNIRPDPQSCTISTVSPFIDRSSDATQSRPSYYQGEVRGWVVVNCTEQGSSYRVALDKGANYDVASGFRQIVHTDGVHFVPYVIGRVYGQEGEWGDADYEGTYTRGLSKSSLTDLIDDGTGQLAFEVPLYAMIDPLVPAFPGTYGDTVRVTVHF